MTTTSVVQAQPAPVRDDSGGAAGMVAGLLLLAIVVAGIAGFVRARRR